MEAPHERAKTSAFAISATQRSQTNLPSFRHMLKALLARIKSFLPEFRNLNNPWVGFRLQAVWTDNRLKSGAPEHHRGPIHGNLPRDRAMQGGGKAGIMLTLPCYLVQGKR
jgi:hypothetical protein